MDDPKLSVAAAILLALVTALTPASVGAQSLSVHTPIPFAAYDRDADGFISRAEFAAFAAQHTAADAGQPQDAGGLTFQALDGNRDGRLSAAEYRAGLRASPLRPGSGGDHEMENEMGK